MKNKKVLLALIVVFIFSMHSSILVSQAKKVRFSGWRKFFAFENNDSLKEVEVKEVEVKEVEVKEVEIKEVEAKEEVKKLSPVKSLTVINASETSYVNVRQAPNNTSKTLGIVFGNLTEVTVLSNKGGYAYIEAQDYTTGRMIKGYVPSSKIKITVPKQTYSVVVDLSEQRVYIYKDSSLIKEMPCSSGIKGSDTPTGRYLIGGRGSSFFSSKYGQGGYNWVRFNRNFLFHSVPFDKTKKIIPEEAAKLGQEASHGCIRLALEDSKWFYNTIPQGSLVVIQE